MYHMISLSIGQIILIHVLINKKVFGPNWLWGVDIPVWWQNKQHEKHAHMQTHMLSLQEPCPVICCNLGLWQFTDFGVELAELAVWSRRFQPLGMAGNNTDTQNACARTREPIAHMLYSGQHAAQTGKQMFPTASPVVWSSFSAKDCCEDFNCLSSIFPGVICHFWY